MKLGNLLKQIPHTYLKGGDSVAVQGICYDSREAGEGSVFVAVSGFNQDGHRFLPEAIGRGATVVVGSDGKSLKPWSLEKEGAKAVVKVKDPRSALARMSAEFFGNPSEKLKVFGVTGTNGKTSTTYMLHHALTHLDGKAAMFGTIENRIGGEVLSVRRTTPESLDLQRLFQECRKAKVKYVAMEVSSHALALSRVEGSKFAGGLFTNLTQDHLDFHGTLEHYFNSKKKLFTDFIKPTGVPGVVSIDCPYGQKLAAFLKNNAVTFGKNKKAEFRVVEAHLEVVGLSFQFSYAGNLYSVKLPVLGLFHAENALGAIALLVSGLGIKPDKAVSFFSDFRGVPGRFEPVYGGQDFYVVVDYAHTPAGVENVLQSAKVLAPKKIITVLGCGGDRDKGKRPLMAKAAEELSDKVIITSDNPRSENPSAIMNDIKAGLKSPKNALLIEDRAKAIQSALNLAKKGDMVVIAGKGHETEQIFADRSIYFDDREVARDLLLGRGK